MELSPRRAPPPFGIAAAGDVDGVGIDLDHAPGQLGVERRDSIEAHLDQLDGSELATRQL
jgi:hypothetical protein